MIATTEPVLHRFRPFDQQARFWKDTSPEVLLSSGWGGGKTRTILEKLLYHAYKYPGNRCLIARKVNADLIGSTLSEFFEKVLPPEHVVTKNKQEQFVTIQTHGRPSEIWWGGLDRATKFGSTEYGYIAVDEANELTHKDWTWLLGRLRRKGPGFRQIAGATNPDTTDHWMHAYFIDHDTRPVYYLPPLDNPHLDDPYIELLESLSGPLYDRYVLGKWGRPEGSYLKYDMIQWVQPGDIPERSLSWLVGVDLATVDDPVKAEETDSNYFAAFVIAYDGQAQTAYGVDCHRVRGRTMHQAVEWLNTIMRALPRGTTAFIESNQAQDWFRQECQKQGLRVEPVPTTKNKMARLITLSIPATSGRVQFVNHDDPSTYEEGRTHDPRWDNFVEEWTSLGQKGAKNDILDALDKALEQVNLGLNVKAYAGRAYGEA